MRPWEVLGLERSAASDTDAVKRAYARLLKQHRPDRDPEGFRRIRDAYECLTGPFRRLALLDGQPADDTKADEPVESTPTHRSPAPGESRPGPPGTAPTSATDDRRAAVTARCSSSGTAEERACGLRELGLPGQPGAQSADDLTTTLAAHPDLLAALCDDVWLIASAAMGATGPLRIVIDHLQQHDPDRLGRLARQAAGEKAILADGPLLLELSRTTASHHPALAQDLLNLAYPMLPPRLRWVVDRIELSIRIGFEMSTWPALQRQLALKMLETGEVQGQMDAELRRRIHVLPYDSTLRQVFERDFPDAMRIPHAEEFKPIIRDSDVAPVEGFSVWKLLLAAMVVLVCARLATCAAWPEYTQAPPRSPLQRYAPPEPARQPMLPFAEIAESLQRLHRSTPIPGRTIDDHIAGSAPEFPHGSLNHRLLLVAMAKDKLLSIAQRTHAIEHLGTLGARRELNSLSTDSLGVQALDQAVQSALAEALTVRPSR